MELGCWTLPVGVRKASGSRKGGARIRMPTGETYQWVGTNMDPGLLGRKGGDTDLDRSSGWAYKTVERLGRWGNGDQEDAGHFEVAHVSMHPTVQSIRPQPRMAVRFTTVSPGGGSSPTLLKPTLPPP